MRFAKIPVACLVLSLLFICNISCRNKLPDVTFQQIRQLEKSWQLSRAEQLIRNLPVDDTTKYAAALSRILLKQGEPKKAEQFLTGLSEQVIQSNAELIYHLSSTYYYRGKLSKSRTMAQKLFQLGGEQNDSLQLARAENLLGRIAFNKAKYGIAREHQYQSLEYALGAGSVQAEANALRQIGVITWYNMNYKTAQEKYFFPALEKYRKIDDKIGEATTLANIGLVYNDQHKLPKSANYNLQAFHIRLKVGDQIGLADSYYFLSNIIATTGWDNTFRYSLRKKSLELSQQIGYKWGAEVAARSLVVLTRHKSIALSQYFKHQVDSLAFQSAEGHIYKKQYEANLAWKTGHLEKSALLFEELLQMHKENNDFNSMSYTYSNAGNVYFELGQYDKAETYFAKAQSLINQSDVPLRDLMIRYNLARIKSETDRLNKAQIDLELLAEKTDSVLYKGVESLTENLYLDHTVSDITHLRNAIYKSLVDLSIKSSRVAIFEYIERAKQSLVRPDFIPPGKKPYDNNTDNAYTKFVTTFEKYEQSPARYDNIQPLVDDLEILMQNHLEKISSYKKFSDAITPKPLIAISDLQSRLDNEEVFINYFVSHKQVLAHVTKSDTSASVRLPVWPNNLQSVTEVLNETIRRGKNNTAEDLWRAPATYLYGKLITPLKVAGFIEPGFHLYISPHHILKQVPFQALRDTTNQKSKFAVEQFNISYLPSATHLVKLRTGMSNKPRSIMAAAPDIHSLPYTEKELEEIPYHNFERHKKLLGSSASSKKISSSLKQFDMFHYAGHININRWFPLSSKINFSDRPVNLFEFLDDPLDFKLVILSACESGYITNGNTGYQSFDDFNGFSNAFLRKGTENVISSQWLIDDKSTSQIMHHFYEQLKRYDYFDSQSQSNLHPPVPYLAKALSGAQRRYIKNADQNKNSTHPFYWAAFRLTGSGH